MIVRKWNGWRPFLQVSVHFPGRIYILGIVHLQCRWIPWIYQLPNNALFHCPSLPRLYPKYHHCHYSSPQLAKLLEHPQPPNLLTGAGQRAASNFYGNSRVESVIDLYAATLTDQYFEDHTYHADRDANCLRGHLSQFIVDMGY